MEGKGNIERLTVRVKEGNRKDECFIPGNKNAIKKVEYICEGERWESEEYKGKAVDKLAEYEDLEEQNRLLKLPCAVGDEFYCIWRNKGQNPIQKMQVKKIEIHERKGIVIQMEFVGNRGCLFRFYEDDFGKTVFLTREEAEAALKEMSE